MNCLYTVSVVVFCLGEDGRICVNVTPAGEIVQASVPANQESKFAAVDAVKAQLDVNLSLLEFVGIVDVLSHSSNLEVNPSRAREVSALYVGVSQDIAENYILALNIELLLARGQKKLALNALDHLAKLAEKRNVGVNFLKDLFTIPQLHAVYSQLWPDCKINLPNFRRKMYASNTINEAHEYINGSKAYVAGFGSLIEPPFSRNSLRNASG